MNDKLRIAACGAVMVFGMATVADAQCGVGFPYSWWGYAYPRSYDNANAYIPYFALYPPVYYSLPVPRTYGYSPFAYPPGTRTPEIVEPEPQIVPNKFVPSKSPAQVDPGKVTIKPLRIANPYVVAKQQDTACTKDVAALQ